MDDRSLNALVDAARQGDVTAFGGLYEDTAAGLYQLALWYLGTPTDAQDAVQTGVLYAFEHIGSLRRTESFRPWLCRIVANACRDLLRQRKRRQGPPLDEVELPVFDRYEDGTVTRLLAELTDQERQIVTLSVLGDMDSPSIARLTGIPAATVRSKLSRSLKKLRERLTESEV